MDSRPVDRDRVSPSVLKVVRDDTSSLESLGPPPVASDAGERDFEDRPPLDSRLKLRDESRDLLRLCFSSEDFVFRLDLERRNFRLSSDLVLVLVLSVFSSLFFLRPRLLLLLRTLELNNPEPCISSLSLVSSVCAAVAVVVAGWAVFEMAAASRLFRRPRKT